MLRSPVTGNRNSVDQVRKNEAASGNHPDGNISMNRTQPLPPLTPPTPNSRKENDFAGGRPSSRRRDERYVQNSNVAEHKLRRKNSFRQSEDGSSSGISGHTAAMTVGGGTGTRSSAGTNITDFFSAEVFRVVLQNPTTAHRLMRFCQSRACGESMEFLQKVEAYTRLLDDLSQLLGTIHSTYISPDAPRQINLPYSDMKHASDDIRQITQHTVPSLDRVFSGAQDHIERLVASDIYPRFVRHQVTASATMALASQRERFQGLGDCFCLTDPRIADNPIIFASDGFVAVTGYTRKDIIPRNCRFLQGEMTDTKAPKRLRASIDNCEETVELLLNYRKNGDPFWNLLYVSPLFNERGEVTFFLGGQINCSTTIHTFTDILKVLSINDDELDSLDQAAKGKPSTARSRDGQQSLKPKSSFFKSWKKYSYSNGIVARQIVVREEPGMEGELVERLGKLTFKTQVEAFYTAYSKYVVMDYHPVTQHLLISHYSPGVIDMLCLNLPNGNVVPIYNKDIFKVLNDYTSSSASSSRSKEFKQKVKDALKYGKAVSVETGLLTGFAERKGGSGWFGGEKESIMRVEERYVTHWTPLKDETGKVGHVVLTIAPKD